MVYHNYSCFCNSGYFYTIGQKMNFAGEFLCHIFIFLFTNICWGLLLARHYLGYWNVIIIIKKQAYDFIVIKFNGDTPKRKKHMYSMVSIIFGNDIIIMPSNIQKWKMLTFFLRILPFKSSLFSNECMSWQQK